ncbi:MAG: dihydrofolate reductase family protein [Chloroflexota bacterium]
MRKLNFYIILTADGMYSDRQGGLGHYEPAEDEHRFANELLRDAGDVVIGRVMYTDFMDYWDEVDIDDPAVSEVEREFARYWRETPKHVVSRGRPPLRANADLLVGDVVEAVRRLKAGDGPDIMLSAGADLLATLSAAGLIDNYQLLLTPMALGAGKAMFASLEAPLSLRLIGTRTFSSGSVLLEYEPGSQAAPASPHDA